jgi:hypothetical protein
MNPSADDFTLLNELWQMIEGDPTCIYPRKLLMEQLLHYGWTDAAVEAGEELIKLDPDDKEARVLVNTHKKKEKPKAAARTRSQPKRVPVPNSEEERLMLEEEFSEELMALQQEVKDLADDMQDLTQFAQSNDMEAHNQQELGHLLTFQNDELKGIVSATATSARETAKKMKETSGYFNLLNIAVTDLETTYDRMKNMTGAKDNDALRELLAKRVRILVSSIPDEIHAYPGLALMQIEHERLGKTYVNDETMLGDEVRDIERNDFLVSEDGYAWSVEELVQAIKANGGVMRNPLSKDMFSPEDIKMILLHPTGKALGMMQLQQSQMANGVRKATIEHLQSLAATVLTDDADDQFESRKAIGKLAVTFCTILTTSRSLFGLCSHSTTC